MKELLRDKQATKPAEGLQKTLGKRKDEKVTLQSTRTSVHSMSKLCNFALRDETEHALIGEIDWSSKLKTEDPHMQAILNSKVKRPREWTIG